MDEIFKARTPFSNHCGNCKNHVLIPGFFMIQTLSDLYTVLSSSEAEVKHILNNIEKHYTPHWQPKMKYGSYQYEDKDEKKIKFRYVLKPSDSLKVLQKKINTYLQQIKLPQYMYGCVEGKNHVLNASQHLNQIHFLTIDLKSFFPNISHQQVFRMFIRNGFSAPVARVLTKLTTFRKSLPQGAPSSPVIANLVFLETAEKISSFSKKYNLIFTNFLDDLSFSSQKFFKNLVPEILSIIKEGEFSPSHKKINYRTDSCEITGLIVSRNKLYVLSKMREKAKTIPNLNAYVKSIDNFNLKRKTSSTHINKLATTLLLG
jgi:RNA-directed DNA polymerase